MPKTDQLHPLAVENAELRERLAQTEALASRVIEERDHHREKQIQAERERDEARALLRAIYRGKWVGPRMRETIEAVVSPRYLRGDSDE